MTNNVSFFCPITFDRSITKNLKPEQVSNLKALEWTSNYWTLSNKAHKVIDLKQLVSLKSIEEVCYLEIKATDLKKQNSLFNVALKIISFFTVIIPFLLFIAHYYNLQNYRLQFVNSSPLAREAVHGLPTFKNLWEVPEDFRKRIYENTLQSLANNKYSYGLQTIALNNTAMLQGTESYDDLSPLDTLQFPGSDERYQTLFSVKRDDTFNVLSQLSDQGKNPVGINMANRYRPGGGVENGCQAQEEALCRRSNYIQSLSSQKYPLPETGGIYSPDVTIFRRDEANGYAFMETSKKVALVAIAAYDLREFSKDRQQLGLPIGTLSENLLKKNSLFMTNTQNKIRNMLRKMAVKGHKHLVLGALGCGAFRSPPKLIAEIFKNIFKEQEFNGRFKTVDFAILAQDYDKDDNVAEFEIACLSLNQ